MKKEIKSMLWTLAILLIINYATKGIVKLFWNRNKKELFSTKVQFINYCIGVFSVIYIIGIYHIVGPYYTEIFYKIYIILFFIYIAIGLFFNEILN
jgi:hypothetical protein